MVEGEILSNCFKFIDFINQNQLKAYSKKDKTFYLSMMVFLEKFFFITLDSLEINENLILSSESKKYVYTMRYFDINLDYKHLVQIMVVRALSNTRIQDNDIISFSLEKLRELLQRIKR